MKEAFEKLKEDIAKIDTPLKHTAKNLVFSDGIPESRVVIIGEAPGRDEDEQGKPFVGRAGRLLDQMLAAIDLDRTKNCYITNIVNYRPPENRTPTPDEIALFRPYIMAHLCIIKPKVILALGATAVKGLLQTQEGISKLRGNFQNLDLLGTNVPVMPTWHPAYLLRDPRQKAGAWEDLKKFKEKIGE